MQHAVNSIIKGFVEAAERSPQKPAIYYSGHTISYKELYEQVLRTAQSLHEHSVKRGDRVLFYGEKSPHFVRTYLACHLVGAIAVPVDVQMPTDELSKVYHRVQPALALFPAAKTWPFPFQEWGEEFMSDSRYLIERFPNPDEVADLLFTTGTTGQKKGVLLTHENIWAGATNSNIFIGNTSEDSEIIPLPLHHAFGLRRLRTNLMLGASVHLINGFMFPKLIFEAIELGASGLCMVPSGLEVIKKLTKNTYDAQLANLSYIEFGSMPMDAATKGELMDKLPHTKLCMHYGLTEVAANIFIEFHEHHNHLHTLGRPSPNVEIGIMNESGKLLPQGELGEIVVKGSVQTPGYWQDDELSQSSIKNGWFRTGDLALITPDGFVELKGRNDDVINVGGKKVFPQEIEDTINQHPDIKDSVCIAVTARLLGEQIKAYVEMEPSKRFDKEGIIEYLRAFLEPYKIPTQFEVIASIPRTSSGKKKRDVLGNEGP